MITNKLTFFLSLVLLVAAAACSAPDPKPNPKAPPKEPKEIVVPQSPKIETVLDGRSLRISHMVSSGGFAFEIVSIKRDGDVTNVRVRLTSPAAGSMTTSAFETHTVDAKLPTDGGTIRVLVRQIRRDELYEVMPVFKLAKTIER